MKVLLVEDDLVAAELVDLLLVRNPGFEVATASSLEEARLGLQHVNPDIVLLDLNLPDGAGIDTYRRLKEIAPQLPIIILSGVDDEELAMTTVKEGAQDYLVKGDFDPRMLVRAIRYAMERLTISRALEDEREFSRALLDAIPERMYVKDAESRFLRVNQQLAKILELQNPKDAVGKSDADFFQTAHAQEAFVDEEQVMRTGRAMVGKVEKEVLLNGDSTWLLTTKMPVRNATGVIVGTFGLSKDITKLKEIEEALRRSEERHRRLLESVMDYVYTVHLEDGKPVTTVHGDGCFTVTGYTREQYQDDPNLWSRMIHPEDLPAVLETFGRFLFAGIAEPIEHRIIHQNGSVRWIRNTPTPLLDTQGRLIAYDGVVADITERKEAELTLQAANVRLRELVAELTRSHKDLKNAQLELIDIAKMQSVGQLAAGVAHEVKNPLAILQLGLEWLGNQECAKDEAIPPVIGEMQVAVARANAVVGGLLDFSSSRTLELTEGDLNAIVKRSLRHVRHLLVEGKITVVSCLALDLPMAVLDPMKMEQVFINLFTNACHAMPGGGTLTVTTTLSALGPHQMPRDAGNRTGLRMTAGEEVLKVEVRDTGTGIAPEKLARVFDPFFTTKPTGQGSGLGLAVCRSIIELHGGVITVVNGPESGIIVTLILRRGSQTSAD